MISRKGAAHIGHFRIYGGPQLADYGKPPYWRVQVEDVTGRYVCSTGKFSSLSEAESVKNELYNFFKSLAENKPIVIVVRNFKGIKGTENSEISACKKPQETEALNFFDFPYLKDCDEPSALLLDTKTIYSICGTRTLPSRKNDGLFTVYFDAYDPKGSKYPILTCKNRTKEEADALVINSLAAMCRWICNKPAASK